ncbi:MAG: T9SS C-terminal target domain-containing protein [Chloroflexi bacterium]|nr:MAG: T9SS C-terminal target domain-containing protein [Chloroflexota bacterium]
MALMALFLHAQIPAFPGAEGFGSATPGGRGGQIIKVTNTNASGPGSLRQALENTPGKRIIIFETGGEIDLQGNNIEISEPFVTIAGQTAPGDGIMIKNGIIRIITHDVIVRGLRFRHSHFQRPGEHFFNNVYGGINITSDSAYNIIIDHCSFAWNVAAGAGVLQGAHDVTFSWCIFGQGLHCNLHFEGCHSKGLVLHQTAGGNLSAHHNIFISNDARNPNLQSPHNEVINNYIYNCGARPMHTYLLPGRTANVIGNVFEPGPDSYNSMSNPDLKALLVEYSINPQTNDTGTAPASVYVFENICPDRPVILSNNPAEEWLIVDDYTNVKPPLSPPPSGQAQSLTPFNLTGVTVTSTTDLRDVLFDSCGAGAIVPYRDSVDYRLLQSAIDNSGKIVDCIEGDDIIIEGIAQGGDFNYIQLDPRATTESGTYQGRLITIVSGPGIGDTVMIIGYHGPSKTAYVQPGWSTPPTSASVYHIIIDCSNNAGGWPAPLNSGTPPTDTDNDGMPDSWEISYGTDPLVADHNGDIDGDGYTNIEAYINHFFNCAVISGCQPPQALWATRITPVSARLNWDSVPSVTTYLIRGRALDNPLWTYLQTPGTQTFKDVYGLYNNKQYIWQVRAVCGAGDTSDWSEPDTFATGCYAPDSHWASPVLSDAARLNWTRISGAVGYEIRGQKLEGNWVQLLIQGNTNTSKDVYGLTPGSIYRWRVRSWCDINGVVKSVYTSLDTFITPANLSSGMENYREPAAGSRVAVYPNPAENDITFEIFPYKNEKKTLTIYNATGQIIKTLQTDENVITIDTKDFAEGLYFYQVRFPNDINLSGQGRFVVQ